MDFVGMFDTAVKLSLICILGNFDRKLGLAFHLQNIQKFDSDAEKIVTSSKSRV